MTQIRTGDACVTLINTFFVAPDKAAQLVQLLEEATTQAIRRQPGFISANLHTSLDGTRVVNYAQWRSKADLDAMLNNPECQPHMGACAALAERFEPVLYAVASVIEP